MKAAERERFDALLGDVLHELPQRLHVLLEESPVIVEDYPSRELLEELGMDPKTERSSLCGLHSGTPLTERSFQHNADMPETIHLFREGILSQAGGWEAWEDEDGTLWGGEDNVREEIRITLLHEIGHHFGLEEDDLEELGYG
ncbi:MAG: metallopeptidase family protein [Phycisphaerales bacterium]|nr:MAG: metallopeptidase family protein [Phycisphaerales bacterium]